MFHLVAFNFARYSFASFQVLDSASEFWVVVHEQYEELGQYWYIKGIVHPKMKIVSFTHSVVILELYDFWFPFSFIV